MLRRTRSHAFLPLFGCFLLLLLRCGPAAARAGPAAAADTADDSSSSGGEEAQTQATAAADHDSSTTSNCDSLKPTLILLSGVGGSQMSGTFSGNDKCAPLVNETIIWYADKWAFSKSLMCWSHHMSLNFDPASGRWSNSTGTEIWPDYGPVFGAFPEKSKQRIFYGLLVKHLLEKHGYVPGRDLFIIPFDWRIGLQGLEQTGGLQRIVDDISRGVAHNCGQKAIVMSHSYGATVVADIFQRPAYDAWRLENVKGWIPIGPTFGGAAATPWLTMLSGDFFKLLPVASNLLKPATTGRWKPTVIGRSVYNFAFGMPTWGWLLPRDGVLGVNSVVVQTPTKNYTASEQKQLLLDMGDDVAASLLDDSWKRADRMLEHGPVPGLETYCFYSTGVVTPETLVFNESVPRRDAMARPYDILFTSGDGVVDLNSLRLCSKVATSPSHVVEVHAPLVDHATILSHPVGLSSLSVILHKMGVPMAGGTWSYVGQLLLSAIGRRRRLA